MVAPNSITPRKGTPPVGTRKQIPPSAKHIPNFKQPGGKGSTNGGNLQELARKRLKRLQ